MTYNDTLKSDPSPLPLQPAILSLVNKRRRAVFVSYTTNARGRAAVFASAIRHRKKAERNHLSDLPEGDINEFVVLCTSIGIEARKGDAAVERMQRAFEKRGYKLFGRPRSAVPAVVLNGKRMSIAEAMEVSGTKSNYQTVYRRIQRGWSTKEALDLA